MTTDKAGTIDDQQSISPEAIETSGKDPAPAQKSELMNAARPEDFGSGWEQHEFRNADDDRVTLTFDGHGSMLLENENSAQMLSIHGCGTVVISPYGGPHARAEPALNMNVHFNDMRVVKNVDPLTARKIATLLRSKLIQNRSAAVTRDKKEGWLAFLGAAFLVALAGVVAGGTAGIVVARHLQF